MVKIGFFAALLAVFTLAPKNTVSDFKDVLTLHDNERGNKTVTAVDDSGLDEVRIYRYEDCLIDEVSDSAFSGTNFSTLVLTNSVRYIDDDAFSLSNISTLKFTGSQEEFEALGLTYNFKTISYYAVDEGFINYWNTYVRPQEGSNICDISESVFVTVYGYYKNLSEDDLARVNAYVDSANAKIEDSMKELINQFRQVQPSRNGDEWNQTGAITLILIIAFIGMTSITVFFLLKTKRIIN